MTRDCFLSRLRIMNGMTNYLGDTDRVLSVASNRSLPSACVTLVPEDPGQMASAALACGLCCVSCLVEPHGARLVKLAIASSAKMGSFIIALAPLKVGDIPSSAQVLMRCTCAILIWFRDGHRAQALLIIPCGGTDILSSTYI